MWGRSHEMLNSTLVDDWESRTNRWLVWPDALKYATKSTLAGYNNWRLPNIKELQSISD